MPANAWWRAQTLTTVCAGATLGKVFRNHTVVFHLENGTAPFQLYIWFPLLVVLRAVRIYIPHLRIEGADVWLSRKDFQGRLQWSLDCVCECVVCLHGQACRPVPWPGLQEQAVCSWEPRASFPTPAREQSLLSLEITSLIAWCLAARSPLPLQPAPPHRLVCLLSSCLSWAQ